MKYRHILKERTKLIDSFSLKELEKKINRFGDSNKIVSSSITTVQMTHHGGMPCDWDTLNGDYATKYIANIRYMHDITADEVNKCLGQWLQTMVMQRFGDNMSSAWFDLTGRRHYATDEIQKYSETLCTTDKYKSMKDELERKYSEEVDDDER